MALLILLALSLGVYAAADNVEYTVLWWSIEGGAESSAGDGFALKGTIGQPDSGQEMQGGEFAVVGGVGDGLNEAGSTEDLLYLPVVMRK